MDSLRQQIYRIKGGNTVCLGLLAPSPSALTANFQDIPIVVVGTKLDLPSEREVQKDAMQSLAAKWGLPFYETSAKRNWHVVDVFEDLVRQMRLRYPVDPERKRKRHLRGCLIM